ncbi:phosphatase PAP2 family protein [Actinomycetospora atypica]|uniref:Phosphatase PAP2 family protein n=1 Tax=Actinomycetospora atypica TaxID=1290095 RepID=A0ABV9YTM9_9PSEU
MTSPVCRPDPLVVRRDAPGRPRPLVRPAQRRWVGPVVGTGAVVLGVLAARYAGDGRAGRVDRLLAELVPMRHGPTAVAGEALVVLGDPVPVAVTMLLLLGLAWWGRGGRGLALVLVGPPAAMVTTSLVLKPIIGRTRGGELALPSGHTTAVASLAVVAALLVVGSDLSRRARATSATGLGLLVLAVGLALVGRGVHYPTDVVAALAVVAVVVPLAALTVDAFADLGETARPDDEVTRRLPVLR